MIFGTTRVLLSVFLYSLAAYFTILAGNGLIGFLSYQADWLQYRLTGATHNTNSMIFELQKGTLRNVRENLMISIILWTVILFTQRLLWPNCIVLKDSEGDAKNRTGSKIAGKGQATKS